MIEYLKTTSVILFMVFILSAVFSGLITALAITWPGRATASKHSAWPIPALITAPLIVVLIYLLTEKNLTFPTLFDVSPSALILHSVTPALVLVIASGILGNLWRSAFHEVQRWQAAPFFKFARAMGLSSYWSLGRLVFMTVLARTLLSCLPWVFGELIIVEAMFQAPGLGLDIWHFAVVQDVESLLHALLWLVALYTACFILAQRIVLSIGERLSSYG